MILAVLDDLMFTSKIKTTAGQLGVAVTFARSADAALSEMRKAAPSLVILDLNNARIDPLGIVSSMKQDPALAAIPTVGYASHVQTDVIAAARQAGVGDVMARSAFTQQLPEILQREEALLGLGEPCTKAFVYSEAQIESWSAGTYQFVDLTLPAGAESGERQFAMALN